jgi:hypothetical protein
MDANLLPTSSESQVSLYDFWLKHIQQRNQSSLSKTAYCKEHGLAYHKYIYREQKLISQQNAPIRLVPVQIVQPRIHSEPKPSVGQLNPSAKVSVLCSLTLKTGAILQVYDPVALNMLITILR